MSTESKVAQHYGNSDLANRILKAMAANGLPTDPLTPDTLFQFDQLHARQLAATREHVGRLALDATMHALDIGSGIGGPARYMASAFGCRVTGIDLTDAFVAAARELTTLCGLSDRVEFQTANALDMPFADATFDAAACQYVAMNIADKAKLIGECRRILKPGGRLVWSSVVAGNGEPRYPLPWARDESVSFLVSPETLRKLFDDSGLRVVEWIDETDVIRAAQAAGPPPPAVRAMSIAVMGDDFPDRTQNFGRNVAEGRLRSVAVVAERV